MPAVLSDSLPTTENIYQDPETPVSQQKEFDSRTSQQRQTEVTRHALSVTQKSLEPEPISIPVASNLQAEAAPSIPKLTESPILPDMPNTEPFISQQSETYLGSLLEVTNLPAAIEKVDAVAPDDSIVITEVDLERDETGLNLNEMLDEIGQNIENEYEEPDLGTNTEPEPQHEPLKLVPELETWIKPLSQELELDAETTVEFEQVVARIHTLTEQLRSIEPSQQADIIVLEAALVVECVALLETLNIDYSPDLIDKMIGIILQNEAMPEQLIATIEALLQETGTYERKQGLFKPYTDLFQLNSIKLSMSQFLGKLVLQLSPTSESI